MKKLSKIIAFAVVLPAMAQNLVQKGDFTGAAEDLSPVCRPESGGVSLYTEDRTWNKCGMCKVTRSYPDSVKKDCVVHSATVTIGLDKDKHGFPVEPGVRYDVSLDVRGLDGAMGVLHDVLCWTGDSYWYDRKSVKNVIPGGIKAEKEWKTFKGSFRVPEGARRAALRLWITSSSRWPQKRQYKIGDAFLFDNVKIVRSRKNIDLGDDRSDEDIPVTLRKTIALGEAFGDLVSFKDGSTPSKVQTEFSVHKDADSLMFKVKAEAQDGLETGESKKVWSGETIEIVLERPDGSHPRTHIAFNNAGAKYTDAGKGADNSNWSLDMRTDGGAWLATARIPLAVLGLKGNERELGFNIGRARSKARTFDVWSVGGAFHDPGNFGRILFCSYADELKRKFGIESSASTRAVFESEWIAAERALFREKMARFKDQKFSFAQVPAVSDWTIPYLPQEVFEPPSEINLSAAVNEICALPLAIANFSGRTEDYRVVIETEENEHIGSWGLAGFPKEQVVARKGIRFKDVDTENPSLRFDPLVRLDEAGTVTVPPREAGLVWYDFDCTGVRPGTYKGRLRIIPMCEPGVFKKNGYAGKMQTVPVTLTVVDAGIPVRPAAPAGYFMGVESQAALDTAFQIGAEHFQVHTWSIQYERDKDGNFDLNRPKKRCVKESEKIKNHIAWAAKHGFKPKFHVVYSAMNACREMYCGKSREKFLRMWPQYVAGVKRLLNDAGVPDSDYFIEVVDEPKIAQLGEVLEAHKIAKAANPSVRLAVLFAAWRPTIAQMREFVPYTDVWILWRNGYWSTKEGRDFAERLRTEGKEVYHYVCETSIRMPLLQYYRHHPWFAERHGLAGSYMYQLTDHIAGGSFGSKDFKSIPYSGLFYRSFGVPVPSLRFMALREGFTDCKLIAALKAKNAKVDDPEIAAFLQSAAVEVIDRNPNDPALPDRMRTRARELLCR